MQSSKGSLFDATWKSSAKKPFETFSISNISNGGVYGGVAVEVSEFEASFDDIEGVRKESA